MRAARRKESARPGSSIAASGWARWGGKIGHDLESTTCEKHTRGQRGGPVLGWLTVTLLAATAMPAEEWAGRMLFLESEDGTSGPRLSRGRVAPGRQGRGDCGR